MADSMSLSPGFLCLKHVDNAVLVAKSIVNSRLLVPDMGAVAYVFRDYASDTKQTEAGDIPIFLKPECKRIQQAPPAKDYAVLSLDTVTSTHSVLEALIKHAAFESVDLLVTSKQQIRGRGRRGDRVWSSPPGGVMFSFTHRFGLQSMMGQHVGFLQHLISLAIVQSVPQVSELRIKWPNDVYYKKSKIAGVVVNCHMGTKDAVALIGVGVNLDNHVPSDCLNRILREDRGSNELIQSHDLISDIVRKFKESTALLQSATDFEQIKQSYMEKWMHTGQEVTFQGQALVVQGVDEQGFLRAKPKDGGGSAVTIGFDLEDVSLPVT